MRVLVMSFFDGLFPLKQSRHNKNRKISLPDFNHRSSVKCNNPFIIQSQKRISPKLSASATVEAAMILPFIILFFVSIMWFIKLFHIHNEIGAKLNLIGNEMVAYSYPYTLLKSKAGVDDELTDLALSIGWTELYVKEQIMDLSVSSKIDSLTTLLSDHSKEDAIDIVVTYSVKPPLDIPGIPSVILTNHFYSKMFVGYNRKETESDELVYITQTGSVYHTSLDCRALKYKVNSVKSSDISNKRNESGAKYYPCEKCSQYGFGNLVYITEYGTRYHSDKKCSELKVNIYEVPLSSVKDRHKCRFCETIDN